MKFVISSSALTSLLTTTGKVISNKNTLPILDYFLFELAGKELTVTASDLETTMISKITVDSVESEGVIAVPLKIIDSLKDIPEQPLTIESDDETWMIKISRKNGSSQIPGTSGLSYPTLPELEADAVSTEFDADTLQMGINKCVFATADDEMRPVMNGIYVNAAGKEVVFVATDGHKMVKFTSEEENEVAASFILSKKPANVLKNMLVKEEGAIAVSSDKKNVVFTLSKCKLICRLIEGVYPNYNAAIPQANPYKVIVDRVEFINAIVDEIGKPKFEYPSCELDHDLIKLDIDTNVINLTAQDLDFSYSAEESVACSYEGANIEIAFKSTYIIDLLNNLDTPSVMIELADSSRAGVFKPIYTDAQSTNTLMLLMPMRINA